MHSLPDNFKAALEEDKHKSLASRRNTGISVPTSIQPRWERPHKVHKQSSSASPRQRGRNFWGFPGDSHTYLVVSLESCAWTKSPRAGEGGAGSSLQPYIQQGMRWGGRRKLLTKLPPQTVTNHCCWRPWLRRKKWPLRAWCPWGDKGHHTDRHKHQSLMRSVTQLKQGASNELLFLPVNLVLKIFAWGGKKKTRRI